MEQPLFGRRLKELRLARGLSQSSLAADEISTGYLSRLESGRRQPTERVVAYLAKQLDVDRGAFEVQSTNTSLAQALSLASSADGTGSVEALMAALEQPDTGDPSLRWQALWLVARHWRQLGDRAEELACLKELDSIAEELDLPELRCRGWAALARCLRSVGEVNQAIEVASKAVQLAREAQLSLPDTSAALMALVSAEAEEGRLPDARAHVDELVELVGESGGVLRAEALWSAATVRLRQGDQEAAREYLERAVEFFDSRTDLTLWARLRLAAASMYLQSSPPLVDRAAERLREAEVALGFVGSPLLNQELLTLRAHLAFEQGDHAQARAHLAKLHEDELWLTYRDRVRLGVLEGRLLILEGDMQEGLRRLKELGEEARRASNVDLAAEIWRLLSEALESAAERVVSSPGGKDA
ncbi:helix-turn-helix domain-containing protein [Streptomyces sp. NPDC058308]|uniref:helix-turn-helix domain-containing protein n=1 Tax=Streptomyces sp. NPDC058308 TaxID=3346440 RepID=UPI0036E7F752